ncbi:MAG: flagellar hook-basal body complex protein FliE [Oscillospiraceae bacterium]|nr:flagellar hook-basal body complex protein FliE [Oscillospiraceae bacterium]
MSINPISPNLVHLLNPKPISADSNKTDEPGGFADVMTEALRTANQTESVDRASTLQLLMGGTDDLSGILLDAQKAELSLQLALQIRNKVIDAYNEIMRMSI